MYNLFILAAAALLCLACVEAYAGQPGDFDAARFGTPTILTSQDAGPKHAHELIDGGPALVEVPAGGSAQIEWNQLRDIYKVKLHFAEKAPEASDIELSYWYHIWPDNGTGGWSRVDDPFNGGFVVAATEGANPTDSSIELSFKPLEQTENPKIKKTGMTWRGTYKVKMTFKTPVRLSEFQCVTDSNYKTAEVKVDMLGQSWDGKVEARNAEIVSASPAGGSTATVKVRYADNPQRLSPDRGYVVVRRGGKATDFSFFVDDVIKDGGVYVRDINAFISDASKNLSYSSRKKSEGAWDATVMDTVSAMPEQTFENAMKTMPQKGPREAHLSLPNLRQEISVDAGGTIFVSGQALRAPGPDKDRSSLPMKERDATMRHYYVTTNEVPNTVLKGKDVKRSLEDGYLPIIHSDWKSDSIDYSQSIFVTALDPSVLSKAMELPKEPPIPMGKDKRAADLGIGLKGDEPIAAVAEIKIANSGQTEQTAYFWLRLDPQIPMKINSDGMMLLEKPTRPAAGDGLTPTFGQIDANGKGELELLKAYKPEGVEMDSLDLIRYTVKLAPGAKHTIYLKVPYIEQLSAEQLAQLKAIDPEKTRKEVAGLWKKRLADAVAEYNVPEPALVNLYRANLWHNLVTTDRDVPTGLYEHGAATFGYHVYVNETAMVARSLEMRGEHEEARRIFEPFIVCQGEKPLPGNFKGQDGLIYAAAPKEFDNRYTAQGYNMHHGFGLWVATEHYFWTRDKEYLKAIAPNLIAGCDWIVRERKATMVMNPDGTRPLEYGLAPAGDLEDVAEYLYWYPTNAYYYLGMKSAADALAEIGHPEAARIASETAKYKDDIMASMRESVATSPVVKLLNGDYVPCVPPRTDVITTCKEGWIREALYSTLHIVDCQLVTANDPLATWILDDLEDRIFMSEVSGYGLKSPKDEFFTFGGFNPQPNLLDTSVAYLKRNQPECFLRAFWNTYSSSVYRDMECFAEWVPHFGEGGGPLYKTPDESKFIQWMRQMLILEMGSDLYVGRGIPREWMADGKTVEFRNAATYFGPMSLKYTSAVGKKQIKVELSLPTRNAAESVHISFRHPEGKRIRSLKVNGKDSRAFDPKTGEATLPGEAGEITVVATY